MLRAFIRELLDKVSTDADDIRRYDDVIDTVCKYMQHKSAAIGFAARRMVKQYIENLYSTNPLLEKGS